MKPAIVIGGDGLLGKAYREHWLQQGVQVPWTSRRRSPTSDAIYLDLENPGLLPWKTWSKQGFQYVFFAAAMTGLLACEKHPERSYQLNVKAPLLLAEQALEYGLCPIFCSSDSVFDGKTGNYTEQSQVNPLHVYGRHKAKLETETLKLGNALILRLTKVYSLKLEDRGLLIEMALLLKQGKPLLAAIDQVFNPIYLDDVILALNALLEQQRTGLIQVAGPEILSRYALACRVANTLGYADERIQAVHLADLETNCSRPLNTSLKINLLGQVYKPLMSNFSRSIEIMKMCFIEGAS